MNILAIDTATEACSVALQYNNKAYSRFEICPQQHSQRLLPMVDEVLKEAGVTLGDLELLAFGRGPGSFTGVRIATGMIQGLALGTGHNVVGVSTLEAMAAEVVLQMGSDANNTQYIAVASDARMDEVYFAVYRYSEQKLVIHIEEQVCPANVAIDQLNKLQDSDEGLISVAGTGWSAYSELNEWRINNVDASDISVTLPNALHMLALAENANIRGEIKQAIDVEPVYLRDKVTWKKLPGRE